MVATAAVRSFTSPALQPFTAAMASPTNGRYDGSFARPRCGTGARNGLSVSTSKRSSGHCAAAARHVGRVLERHDATERDVHACVQAPIGFLRPAGEAVQHRAFGNPLGIEHVEQVGPGVARVDDQCEAVRVGQLDLRRECGALGRHAASARSSSPVRTRPPPPPRHRRGSPRAPAAPPPRRLPRSPRGGAARWRPTPGGTTRYGRSRGPRPPPAARWPPRSRCTPDGRCRPPAPGPSRARGRVPRPPHRGTPPARGSGSRTSPPRQALRRGNRGSPFTTVVPPA